MTINRNLRTIYRASIKRNKWLVEKKYWYFPFKWFEVGEANNYNDIGYLISKDKGKHFRYIEGDM